MHQITADKFCMIQSDLTFGFTGIFPSGRKSDRIIGNRKNPAVGNSKEAIRLAKTTELSWKEISVRVGYVNYISFLKYFVKKEGILLTAYQR